MFVLGIVLMVFGAFVTWCNMTMLATWFLQHEHQSQIPLLGGPLFMLGAAWSIGWPYGLVGVFVDPGCALLIGWPIAHGIMRIAREARSCI